MTNERQRELRKAREQYAKEHPEDPRHGTPNFYNNYGCRCDECRPAHSLAQAGFRARAVPDARYFATRAALTEHLMIGSRTCLCGYRAKHPETVYDHITKEVLKAQKLVPENSSQQT